MRGYDPSAIPDRDPDQETLALSICKSCSVLLAFCDLADAEAAVDQLAAVSAHHAWVIRGLLHGKVTVSVTRPDWPVWS